MAGGTGLIAVIATLFFHEPMSPGKAACLALSPTPGVWIPSGECSNPFYTSQALCETARLQSGRDPRLI